MGSLGEWRTAPGLGKGRSWPWRTRLKGLSAIIPACCLETCAPYGSHAAPFDSDQYIIELKVDGFRALAHIEAGHGELIESETASLEILLLMDFIDCPVLRLERAKKPYARTDCAQ